MKDFASGVTSDELRFDKAQVVAVAKELVNNQLVTRIQRYLLNIMIAVAYGCWELFHPVLFILASQRLQVPPFARMACSTICMLSTVTYCVKCTPLSWIPPAFPRKSSFALIQCSAGKEVHAWTVDELSFMHRMLESGVDAVVTGQPRKFFRAISKHQRLCTDAGYSS